MGNERGDINLSYIVTTYNKISYLKVVIEDLIASLEHDEEIVVFDGGSKDGTADFLNDLYLKNKIQFFQSENDLGEAHGYNKGILKSKGKILKIITDDDCFNYAIIKEVKKYMLKNEEVDVVGFNGLSFNLNMQNPELEAINYNLNYSLWQSEKKPFFYCGLGLMFRRTAIPIIGLLNTSFKMVDFDYTLKITSSNINLQWCLSPCFVAIQNPDSNSTKLSKIMYNERKRAEYYYQVNGKSPLVIFKIYIVNNIIPLFLALKNKRKLPEHVFENIYKNVKAELNKNVSFIIIS